MEQGYKIKSTYETHDPEKIRQLMDKKPMIGGTGLLEMLQDTIGNLGSEDRMPTESPFHVLSMDDFIDDPVVEAFKHMGGPEKVVKIISSPDAHKHLHHAYNRLNNIKLAEERNTLRYAYMALQNFLDKSNEAAKLERVAYKTSEKSSGYWQIESINAIDKLKSFASTSEKNVFVNKAREVILSGNKKVASKISNYLHNWYSEITPKENKRVAYTTLSTQNNEPYLLCPKGKFNGSNHHGPVPMEISKCRENCIDSRVDKDGHVTCAYQDWLKVAFQSHDEVMARLDVHKHPDNEANALELNEGERSKKLTEGEIGYEARFEHSDRGANKIRGKQNVDDSREKQLSDAKQSAYGHQQGDKPVLRPKQAQTDANKTIDSQLPRKDQKGNLYLENLLRRLNKTDVEDIETREESLDKKGLYTHRGEMEDSYAKQLSKDGKDPVNYRDELNKNFDEPKDSIIHELDKNITASKKELNKEQILDSSRKKNVVDVAKDEQLEDKRKNDKYKVNIEALLDDEDEDNLGHQFSDEDLKKFADELGLDYVLESKREEYDDVV